MSVATLEMPKSTQVFEPAVFTPMPIARTEASYEALIDAQRAQKLIAFIIRKSEDPVNVETAHMYHEQNLNLVLDSLATWYDDREVYHSPQYGEEYGAPFKGYGDRRIGTLHHDFRDTERDTGKVQHKSTLFLNTTEAGSGEVLVGAFGTDLKTIMGLEGASPASVNQPKHPHKYLLDGLVDRTILQPVILQGKLQAGDTIVIADDEATGYGSWHRFDTEEVSLGLRTVRVSDIMSKPRPAGA